MSETKSQMLDMLPTDERLLKIRPIYSPEESKVYFQSEPFVRDGQVFVKRVGSVPVHVEMANQIVTEYDAREVGTFIVTIKHRCAAAEACGHPCSTMDVEVDAEDVKKAMSDAEGCIRDTKYGSPAEVDADVEAFSVIPKTIQEESKWRQVRNPEWPNVRF